MKLIKEEPISLAELTDMATKMYQNLVKAVVDVEKEIMIVDAQMHVDQELVFLEELDSKQEHLWGINLIPERYPSENWIVFDSMINIRPSWGNRTRKVDDPRIQEQIRKIVSKLVSA